MGRASYKCCIIGCTNSGNISHRFPNPNNYLGQLKLWVSIIGHELCSMTPLEIYHRKRVCSIHFTDDSLSPGTSKLKRNALPTLHMPPEDSASCSATLNSPSYSLFDADISGIECIPSKEQHLDESLKDVTNTLKDSASFSATLNSPSYSLFDVDISGIECIPSKEQHLDESLKDVTNTLSK